MAKPIDTLIKDIRRESRNGDERARIAFLTDEAVKIDACSPAIIHCRKSSTWEQLADGYQADWAAWMVRHMGATLTVAERAYWLAIAERDPLAALELFRTAGLVDEERAEVAKVIVSDIETRLEDRPVDQIASIRDKYHPFLPKQAQEALDRACAVGQDKSDKRDKAALRASR